MNSIVRMVGVSFGVVCVALLMGTLGCSQPDYSYMEETDSAVMGEGSTEPAFVASSPDTLRPGDRIEVGFSGNVSAPNVPHQEQIRDDGYITPPLLGTNVLAAGKTIGQLQSELHSLYVPAFFQTLTVTVRSEERYFFAGGQVKAPGQKLYLAEMTVLKAIQAAGDFTDFANRKKVEIRRKDGTRLVVDCKRAMRHPEEDLPIYPGDIIHVPQRW